MSASSIDQFNRLQGAGDRDICERLQREIDAGLPAADAKVWHAHPVWFLDGNPIVGYNKLKAGIRLMFWSGADFDEAGLRPGTGKFRDASVIFTSADQIDPVALGRWLTKAATIRWNYRNLMRNGRLVRLS
jgi:hypothetical protein